MFNIISFIRFEKGERKQEISLSLSLSLSLFLS